MKSLIVLWQVVANELATRCSTSATMDIKTVQGRSKHEGSSFLTMTLPAFGKDFEKSLDLGRVDRNMFQGFSWHAGLPRFLGGFLDLVFDRGTGVLLEDPSVDAIQSIRQLTLMVGKLFLLSSDARTDAAMRGYLQVEKEVRVADSLRSEAMVSDFRRVAALLYARAFTDMDRKIYAMEHVPAHGPGSTADRLSGNRKFRQSTWPVRLNRSFPSGEFLIPNASFWEDVEDEIDFLDPGSEIPVRVISVPKTQKTPRIIGIEPTAMQYAQQSILPVIIDSISGDFFLNSMLGFDDQEPNQLMAQRGSLFGDLATLDLSDASDRVSYQLVRELFSPHAWLSHAVDDCRSRKADVPGYGVQRLAKFASMGSALCFPVEAMVFLTIVMIGIERELKTPLNRRIISEFVGQVRIYGDDIIVPVDYVQSVIDSLEDFGLRVNSNKSFWTGRFRESCGKEYYNGDDVSIVKVRQNPPTSRNDATGIISWVAMRNQFYWQGMWQTTRWLDQYIGGVLSHFPNVDPTSPVLGRESVLGYSPERISEDTHSPLVKGYVISARPPYDPLDGKAALLKFFLKKDGLPTVDERHLERSGRPHAVYIKLRWSPPF